MAISFDASVSGGSATATSLTFAHTTTGTDRMLFVGALTLTANTDTISGITYGGVAMTRPTNGFVTDATNYGIYIYALHAPTEGANNVVISSSLTTIFGIASSYTGASQTSTVDSSAKTAPTAAATLTTTTTTVADNCWLVMMARTEDATPFMAAGTNTTLRQNNTNDSIAMFDSNAAKTPAGSHSLQTTQAGTLPTFHVLASFAPAVAVSFGARRMRLGIG